MVKKEAKIAFSHSNRKASLGANDTHFQSVFLRGRFAITPTSPHGLEVTNIADYGNNLLSVINSFCHYRIREERKNIYVVMRIFARSSNIL